MRTSTMAESICCKAKQAMPIRSVSACIDEVQVMGVLIIGHTAEGSLLHQTGTLHRASG